MATPVSSSEAQRHLRLTNLTNDETTQLTLMIEAATHYAEDITKRDLTTSTKSHTFDDFPRTSPYELRFPKGGEFVVDAITYWDDDYTEQTLGPTDYRVVTKHGRTSIYPALGEEWPTDVAEDPGVVTVSVIFVAASKDPKISQIKSAILLIVGALWEYREDGVIDQGIVSLRAPVTARNLLSSLRQA